MRMIVGAALAIFQSSARFSLTTMPTPSMEHQHIANIQARVITPERKVGLLTMRREFQIEKRRPVAAFNLARQRCTGHTGRQADLS
jgi:hypothetical protein